MCAILMLKDVLVYGILRRESPPEQESPVVKTTVVHRIPVKPRQYRQRRSPIGARLIYLPRGTEPRGAFLLFTLLKIGIPDWHSTVEDVLGQVVRSLYHGFRYLILVRQVLGYAYV